MTNLSILPAGINTSNPAELLGSARMKKLLELMRARFDFIVVDTPPILSFTDAAVLSSSADTVLFVVRSEHTTKQTCISARDALERANVTISGVLMNGADVSSANYKHYYGYSAAKYRGYYSNVQTRPTRN